MHVHALFMIAWQIRHGPAIQNVRILKSCIDNMNGHMLTVIGVIVFCSIWHALFIYCKQHEIQSFFVVKIMQTVAMQRKIVQI